jgi:hypothetical protein
LIILQGLESFSRSLQYRSRPLFPSICQFRSPRQREQSLFFFTFADDIDLLNRSCEFVSQQTIHIIDVNASLKRFDPQFWLPFLTFAWGIASVAQGLVTNQAGLFGIRICKYLKTKCIRETCLTQICSTWSHRSWFVSRRSVHILCLLPTVKTSAYILFGFFIDLAVQSGTSLARRRFLRWSCSRRGIRWCANMSPHLQYTESVQVSLHIPLERWKVWEVNAGGNGKSSPCTLVIVAYLIRIRIFILEGLLTIAVSTVAFFFVPTWPQKAKWVFRAFFLQNGHINAAAAVRCRAVSPPGSSRLRLRCVKAGKVFLEVRAPGFPRPLNLGLCPLVPRVRVCVVYIESFLGVFLPTDKPIHSETDFT